MHAKRLARIAFGAVVCISAAVAGEPDKPAVGGPVGPYSLASVTFEYTESGGSGTGPTITTVRGDGTGSRVSHPGFDRVESNEFAVEPKQVFKLLDLCYRKGFFDLNDRYGPPNWPRLRPDGMIDVMGTIIADGGGRAVTVRVGNYSKSVGYAEPGGDPPIVVLELVRRIGELPSRTAPK